MSILMRAPVVALLLLTPVACGRTSNDGGGPATVMIRADGSSTVAPISEAVAEEFGRDNPHVRPIVGTSGTGGGFQKFCAGETDISNASRPIRRSEIDACGKAGIEYIELPVAYDGLAVVVNPKNTWAASMTVDELKRLWEPAAQGTIMRWSQIRTGWPDREIHLFGAGVDSGTFDYFTEAIVGKTAASRGDYTSSEDDNVLVQGIAGDELALGFMGLAYVEQNKDRLKLVGIDDGRAENGDGPISPSRETVLDGTYQPLSRPLFIYVSRRSADRPEVEQLVEAHLESTDLIREVGYIELPARLYDVTRRHFSDKRVGTAFPEGGPQVGMTLEELLTRER